MPWSHIIDYRHHEKLGLKQAQFHFEALKHRNARKIGLWRWSPLIDRANGSARKWDRFSVASGFILRWRPFPCGIGRGVWDVPFYYGSDRMAEPPPNPLAARPRCNLGQPLAQCRSS